MTIRAAPDILVVNIPNMQGIVKKKLAWDDFLFSKKMPEAASPQSTLLK